jgi:predicted metalloprotease with PDZ domain
VAPGKERAYIGLNFEARDGMASVSAALSDGPAYSAGVIAGDLIVAANGQRVRSGADVDSLVRALKPGDAVALTLFRYDTLREIRVTLGSKAESRLTLRRVKAPSEEQKAAYASWLGQPWPDSGAGRPDDAGVRPSTSGNGETYRPRRRPSR